MSGLGGYIWFIGLGACLAFLVVAYFVADMRKPKRAGAVGGNPNHAWEQAAAESGSPEVAKQPPTGS